MWSQRWLRTEDGTRTCIESSSLEDAARDISGLPVLPRQTKRQLAAKSNVQWQAGVGVVQNEGVRGAPRGSPPKLGGRLLLESE